MKLPFSANLGLLWTELALPDAVRAAASAGFQAVELHWPYAVEPVLVGHALAESGLPVLGLNTSRGNVDAGDFGLSALPGREREARAAIDQAIAYSSAIGAAAVHVMAGKAVREGIDLAGRSQSLSPGCTPPDRRYLRMVFRGWAGPAASLPDR